MKLVILGANGRTGTHVVQEALAGGDMVTAIVRSEAKRPLVHHPQLKVAVGDPCNPTFLAEVFGGQDAVISTLGGRSPTKKATSIYWWSANAIVEAAGVVGLGRVAVTSSALLFPSTRFVDKLLVNLVSNVVQSAARMEETLLRANLDVIVGRCGFLTDQDEKRYRAELGALPENGSSVSRLSVASFLLDKIRAPSSGKQIYGVARVC